MAAVRERVSALHKDMDDRTAVFSDVLQSVRSLAFLHEDAHTLVPLLKSIPMVE
eukprot:gene4854-15143_t